MDIDRALISSVVFNKSIREAIDQQLSPDYFVGDGRLVWLWMCEHYTAYHDSPGREALNKKFPKYELIETTETLAYWCDEIRRRFVFNATRDAIAKSTDALKRKEPDEAVGVLRAALFASEQVQGARRDAKWSETREDRLLRYEQRKECGGIIGLPMPLERLTKTMGGMLPGEFVVVAAASGVGKTWFTVAMSSTVRRVNGNVLLTSKEMTLEQLGFRTDAYECKLDYEEFRLGRLDIHTEDRYRRWLTEKPEGGEIILNDDVEGGVTWLAAKIDLYRPHMAIVDGFYLMDDDTPNKSRNSSGWERVGNISKALKRLAKKAQIPIVVTGQLNADGELAYFKGIQQDADTVIKLSQDNDGRMMNRMCVEMVKHREGRLYKEEIEWNLTTMTIAEFPKEETEY